MKNIFAYDLSTFKVLSIGEMHHPASSSDSIHPNVSSHANAADSFSICSQGLWEPVEQYTIGSSHDTMGNQSTVLNSAQRLQELDAYNLYGIHCLNQNSIKALLTWSCFAQYYFKFSNLSVVEITFEVLVWYSYNPIWVY